MIDLYCERTGPGLLAEPLNASTNLAFFLAAILAWRLARRLRATEPGILLLIALAVGVGAGSTLFHTLATFWAQVLDILPILLFQIVFLFLYLRRVVRLSPLLTSILDTLYLALCLLTLIIPPYLNGSIAYLPTLAALALLAVYHWRTRQPAPGLLVLALLVFSVSLGFRSVDLLVCPYLSTGTHYLWHLLNGALLYLAMKALILKQAALTVEPPRNQSSLHAR